jgi:putative ABC transport system permease protein
MMLRNYLKVTFRNLIKHKTFSFINIVGLAAGMASFMLISLWIKHEIYFEQFHENRNSLYRVYTNVKEEGRFSTANTTPVPLAEVLKTDFSEVVSVCRTSWVTNHLLQHKDKKITAGGIFTDPEFLRMFSFPLLKGNEATVLTDPNSIVLTEEFAVELFGNLDPINKIIRLDDKHNYRVTGVFKSIPANTSFSFNYLLPYRNFSREMEWAENNWGSSPIHTYVALHAGTSVDRLQAEIKHLPRKHGEENVQLFLHPLTKWHLYSRFENGEVAGGRIEVVRFFGVTALLILIMACINFINLSTVRSEKRAKEVGIRKCIGARKRDFILQFLGESVIYSFLSGSIALIIILMCRQTLIDLVSVHFQLDFGDPYFWLAFGIFILLTGVLAGIYPAVYLSSFRPVYVLKGIFKKRHSLLSFQKVLVILQFTFGIVMIVSIIVIQKQIQHAQQRDAGYNKEMLIYTQYFGDLKQNYPRLKQELLNAGLATSVTQTNSPITELWDTSAKLKWQGKAPGQSVSFNILCADDKLVETFGLELIAGRDFSLETFSTDSLACLLNESAVQAMGFRDPLGQTIQGEDNNWHVVGVVKDFIMGSPHANIEPLVIYGAKGWFHVVHIKLNEALPLVENLEKIEKIVKAYNPSYPFEFSFVDEAYARKFSDAKQVADLSGLFTGLSIFIACIGLFGLTAFMAEERTREIGIRKVLGASVASIVTLLSKDFLKLVILANVVAWPLAGWMMHRWLQDFAYRTPMSWWFFALAGGFAMLIALLAVSFLAVKAAMANPVKNLRTE